MNMKKCATVVAVVLVLVVFAVGLGYARSMRSMGGERFGEHRGMEPGMMRAAEFGPLSRTSIHWETYLVLLSEKYAPELTEDLKNELDRTGTMLEEVAIADWSERIDEMQEKIDEWRDLVRQERTRRDPDSTNRRQSIADRETTFQSFRMRMEHKAIPWSRLQLPEGLTSHRELMDKLGEALINNDPEAVSTVLSAMLSTQRTMNDALEAMLAEEHSID